MPCLARAFAWGCAALLCGAAGAEAPGTCGEAWPTCMLGIEDGAFALMAADLAAGVSVEEVSYQHGVAAARDVLCRRAHWDAADRCLANGCDVGIVMEGAGAAATCVVHLASPSRAAAALGKLPLYLDDEGAALPAGCTLPKEVRGPEDPARAGRWGALLRPATWPGRGVCQSLAAQVRWAVRQGAAAVVVVAPATHGSLMLFDVGRGAELRAALAEVPVPVATIPPEYYHAVTPMGRERDVALFGTFGPLPCDSTPGVPASTCPAPAAAAMCAAHSRTLCSGCPLELVLPSGASVCLWGNKLSPAKPATAAYGAYTQADEGVPVALTHVPAPPGHGCGVDDYAGLAGHAVVVRQHPECLPYQAVLAAQAAGVRGFILVASEGALPHAAAVETGGVEGPSGPVNIPCHAAAVPAGDGGVDWEAEGAAEPLHGTNRTVTRVVATVSYVHRNKTCSGRSCGTRQRRRDEAAAAVPDPTEAVGEDWHPIVTVGIALLLPTATIIACLCSSRGYTATGRATAIPPGSAASRWVLWRKLRGTEEPPAAGAAARRPFFTLYGVAAGWTGVALLSFVCALSVLGRQAWFEGSASVTDAFRRVGEAVSADLYENMMQQAGQHLNHVVHRAAGSVGQALDDAARLALNLDAAIRADISNASVADSAPDAWFANATRHVAEVQGSALSAALCSVLSHTGRWATAFARIDGDALDDADHPGAYLAGRLVPARDGPLAEAGTLPAGRLGLFVSRYVTPLSPAMELLTPSHPLAWYFPIYSTQRGFLGAGSVALPLAEVQRVLRQAASTHDGIDRFIVYAPHDGAVLAATHGEAQYYSVRPTGRPGGTPFMRLHTLASHPDPAVNAFGAYLARVRSGTVPVVVSTAGFRGRFDAEEMYPPGRCLVTMGFTRRRRELTYGFLQMKPGYQWRTEMAGTWCEAPLDLAAAAPPPGACFGPPKHSQGLEGVFFNGRTEFIIFHKLTLDHPDVASRRAPGTPTDPAADEAPWADGMTERAFQRTARIGDEFSERCVANEAGDCMLVPAFAQNSYTVHITVHPLRPIAVGNPDGVILFTDAADPAQEAAVVLHGDGSLQLNRFVHGCETAPAPAGLPVGAWTAVTAVVDYAARTCAVYLNGTLHDLSTITRAFTADVPGGPVVAGVRFVGLMNHVVVFNTTLSADAVATYAPDAYVGTDQCYYNATPPAVTYHVSVGAVGAASPGLSEAFHLAGLFSEVLITSTLNASASAAAQRFDALQTRLRDTGRVHLRNTAAVATFAFAVVIFAALLMIFQPLVSATRHLTDALLVVAELNPCTLEPLIAGTDGAAAVFTEQAILGPVAQRLARNVAVAAPYVTAGKGLSPAVARLAGEDVPGWPAGYAAIAVVQRVQATTKAERHTDTEMEQQLLHCAVRHDGYLFTPDYKALGAAPAAEADMWAFAFGSCLSAYAFAMDLQLGLQWLTAHTSAAPCQAKVAFDYGRVAVRHRAPPHPSTFYHDGAPVLRALLACLDGAAAARVCVTQAAMDELLDAGALARPPRPPPVEEGSEEAAHAENVNSVLLVGGDGPTGECSVAHAGVLVSPGDAADAGVAMYFLTPTATWEDIDPSQADWLDDVVEEGHDADGTSPTAEEQDPAGVPPARPAPARIAAADDVIRRADHAVRPSVPDVTQALRAAAARVDAARPPPAAPANAVRDGHRATVARVDLLVHRSFSLNDYRLFEGDGFIAEAFAYVVGAADRHQGTVLHVVASTVVLGWNVVGEHAPHLPSAVHATRLLAASVDGRQEYQDLYAVGVCTGKLRYRTVGDAARQYFRPSGPLLGLSALLCSTAEQLGVVALHAALPPVATLAHEDPSLVGFVRPINHWGCASLPVPVTVYQINTAAVVDRGEYGWTKDYIRAFTAEDWQAIQSHSDDAVLLIIVSLRERGEQLLEPKTFHDEFVALYPTLGDAGARVRSSEAASDDAAPPGSPSHQRDPPLPSPSVSINPAASRRRSERPQTKSARTPVLLSPLPQPSLFQATSSSAPSNSPPPGADCPPRFPAKSTEPAVASPPLLHDMSVDSEGIGYTALRLGSADCGVPAEQEG